MDDETPRPDFVTDDHLNFLDFLNDGGTITMLATTVYIMDNFDGLTKTQARDILLYWMRSFSERHPGKGKE